MEQCAKGVAVGGGGTAPVAASLHFAIEPVPLLPRALRFLQGRRQAPRAGLEGAAQLLLQPPGPGLPDKVDALVERILALRRQLRHAGLVRPPHARASPE